MPRAAGVRWTRSPPRAPIPEPERGRIHAAACAITTLALLDALESLAPEVAQIAHARIDLRPVAA